MTQPTETLTLFDGGHDGYHTYRIPALLTAANGDLLAFVRIPVAGLVHEE